MLHRHKSQSIDFRRSGLRARLLCVILGITYFSRKSIGCLSLEPLPCNIKLFYLALCDCMNSESIASDCGYLFLQRCQSILQKMCQRGLGSYLLVFWGTKHLLECHCVLAAQCFLIFWCFLVQFEREPCLALFFSLCEQALCNSCHLKTVNLIICVLYRFSNPIIWTLLQIRFNIYYSVSAQASVVLGVAMDAFTWPCFSFFVLATAHSFIYLAASVGHRSK